MLRTLRTLWRSFQKRRFAYSPLVEVCVSRDAILHNLRTFQKYGAVAPVLKSNAYGHGLVEVAHIVDREDIPFLCVDSYFEALILRNEGVRSPILILGFTPVETILENQLADVAFGVVDIEILRQLSQKAQRAVTIHPKVDTGMHRHGILMGEINEAIGLIHANANIQVEGLYSHFADADTEGSEHAAMQIRNWNGVAGRFKSELPQIRFYHMAATSGSVFTKEIDANVMRLGIGLYGINASLASLPLRPALVMRTRITSIRTIQKGESVGYNATYSAPQQMRVATIPAGYYEGIDRRLSNKGAVTIEGIACRIVGRVSMNITSIDVTHLKDVRVGTPVVVISDEPRAPNSVESIARECATIPYEILVHIPAHLRRVVC